LLRTHIAVVVFLASNTRDIRDEDMLRSRSRRPRGRGSYLRLSSQTCMDVKGWCDHRSTEDELPFLSQIWTPRWPRLVRLCIAHSCAGASNSLVLNLLSSSRRIWRRVTRAHGAF